MVVSYRLSIVTVALAYLWPFGRNLRSNVCDAQINRGWVTLGQNLGVFPSEQTRHVGVAKSERPKLTDGEIISEEFQPMWSQFTNVTDGQTDGQTDKQTTCDRNTALCTKVHRAVKILRWKNVSRISQKVCMLSLRQERSVCTNFPERSICLWRYVLWLNGASYSKIYYWEPIVSRIWEIDWYQNEWPWPLFRGHV